ncbi:MAG: rhodanese-like domain-containing protein [Aquabacterium sp.]|jgi:rhodanese-related sulfurtransferase|nr:MAG: rhodanese-like domain-containing protein [Aquabacterium sp.]
MELQRASRNRALACAALLLALAAGCRAEDLIRKIGHGAVLGAMRDGHAPLLVDAREAAEFEEERLPGAVNLTLREVTSARFSQEDRRRTVIAYCVKDFRGYEVARALRRAGFTNVRVFEDPGLKGWKKARLPTAGTLPGVADDAALRELQRRSQQAPAGKDAS